MCRHAEDTETIARQFRAELKDRYANDPHFRAQLDAALRELGILGQPTLAQIGTEVRKH